MCSRPRKGPIVILIIWNTSRTLFIKISILLDITIKTESLKNQNGLETVEVTVSATNEIQQATQSLVGNVDAIYIPTDNMMATAMPTISIVTDEAKIPVICGESALIESGALATYGINYYELGKLTAKQAVAIIENKSDIKEMPIEYLNNFELVIDLEKAEFLGIDVPEELLKKLKE